MATNRKVIGNILLAFACLCVICYRVFSLWNSFLPDFHVYFYATQDLLRGVNPYTDTFLFTGLGYPIISLLPFIFLTFLSFTIASKIFLFLNIFALLGIVYFSLKIIKQYSLRYFLIFLLAALFFFPVSFTIGMGQINLIAFFFLLLGIYLQKRFDFYPGILIAIAIILKPILIFLLLFFLLEKNWKMLLVTIGTLLILVLVSMKLFGILDYVYYMNHQIPQLLNLSGRDVYYNQGFTGFIARFTSNLLIIKYIPLFLSILTIFSLFFLWIKKIAYEHLLSLFLISLLLIDTLSWQHHFVFLIFPFITLFFAIKEHKQKILLYLIWGTSFLLTGMNLANLHPFTQFPNNILLSHAFWGTILLYGLFVYTTTNCNYLQNKKFTFSIFIIFLAVILTNYLLFISCRGHICLR